MSPLRLPFRHPGKFSSGAGKRSRTSDLRITNALLYQLSYTGNQKIFPCGTTPHEGAHFIGKIQKNASRPKKRNYLSDSAASKIGFECAKKTVFCADNGLNFQENTDTIASFLILAAPIQTLGRFFP